MSEKMQKAMVSISTTVPLVVLLGGFFWLGGNLATLKTELIHIRMLLEGQNRTISDHGERIVRIEAYLGFRNGSGMFDGKPRSSQ